MISQYPFYHSRLAFLREVQRAKHDFPLQNLQIDGYREYIEGRANYIGIFGGGQIFQTGITYLRNNFPAKAKVAGSGKKICLF